jgi:hypothetical protein
MSFYSNRVPVYSSAALMQNQSPMGVPSHYFSSENGQEPEKKPDKKPEQEVTQQPLDPDSIAMRWIAVAIKHNTGK